MAIELLMRTFGHGLIPANQLEAQHLSELSPGVYKVRISQDRTNKFHNKFMVMIRYLFNLWEPVAEEVNGVPVKKDFDSFREYIVIRAGHFEQVFLPDGAFKIAAKSVSWNKLDNVAFEQLYSRVIDVGLSLIGGAKYMTREKIDEAVETLLRGYA